MYYTLSHQPREPLFFQSGPFHYMTLFQPGVPNYLVYVQQGQLNWLKQSLAIELTERAMVTYPYTELFLNVDCPRLYGTVMLQFLNKYLLSCSTLKRLGGWNCHSKEVLLLMRECFWNSSEAFFNPLLSKPAP